MLEDVTYIVGWCFSGFRCGGRFGVLLCLCRGVWKTCLRRRLSGRESPLCGIKFGGGSVIELELVCW